MFKTIPFLVAALALTGGCLHHSKPVLTPELSDAQTDTYVSDCEHRKTGIHHHVVEQIGPIEGRCETKDVEVTEYDHLGDLVGLERYRIRCGIKTAATSYHCRWGFCEKTTTVDFDRDGYVDSEKTESTVLAPSTPVEALANSR
jgi:hypothetical protein